MASTGIDSVAARRRAVFRFGGQSEDSTLAEETLDEQEQLIASLADQSRVLDNAWRLLSLAACSLCLLFYRLFPPQPSPPTSVLAQLGLVAALASTAISAQVSRTSTPDLAALDRRLSKLLPLGTVLSAPAILAAARDLWAGRIDFHLALQWALPFGAVLVAWTTRITIDSSTEDLERLKYGFKGA